jgi:hypothetical protein
MRNFLTVVAFILTLASITDAQKRRNTAVRSAEIGQIAMVMDESISVLRSRPSLYAEPAQRLRMGRKVKIMGVVEADGVKFYRVTAMPPATGWIQADAVFGKFRATDEERFARLVHAANGFDQIEAAVHFFNTYPSSQFRAPLLLLFGDLVEDLAVKLARDAGNRLSRRMMAASGAPLHSYYLSYVGLDRYRKLGVTFLFNPVTRRYHYDGAAWKEAVAKYPNTNEGAEARKRLDSLKEKMNVNAAAIP